MYYTDRTFKLQDGNLFNLPRRVKRHTNTLLQYLTQVRDGRSKYGKRHALENILVMVFCGTLAGCSNLTAIAEWALSNRRFLKTVIEMPHGIPHPTTISYAFQLCDVTSLVAAYLKWRQLIYGVIREQSASFDGKTMRAVSPEDDTIRHILTLITHETITTIGQVGVDSKENEIPAALRLFAQTPRSLLAGITLMGDALHTQKDTAAAICSVQAHYLLIVKGNQKQLLNDITTYFSESNELYDTASDVQFGHGATITTTCAVSHAPLMLAYLSEWTGITSIGRIHRRGIRTHHKQTQLVDETVYFIASTPDLTAQQAIRLVRNHWKIENNLHRTKDMLYREDQQTLRLGVPHKL